MRIYYDAACGLAYSAILKGRDERIPRQMLEVHSQVLRGWELAAVIYGVICPDEMASRCGAPSCFYLGHRYV